MKIANLLPSFNDLLSFWNQHNNDPRLKFITLKKETPLNINELFKNLDGPQKTFWCSKDKTKKILSFGEVKYFLTNRDLKDSHAYFKNNPDLLIIGSLPFDSEYTDDYLSRFKIPWVTFEKINNKTNVYINLSLENIKTYDELFNFYKKIEQNISSKKTKSSKLIKKNISEYPSFENWKNSVDNALSLIKENKFKKIVLSRRINIEFKNALDPEDYFVKLTKVYSDKNSYHFFQKDNENYFISFSPEKLFSIEKDKLSIDIIAGTVARGSNQEEDNKQLKKLKESEKDLLEHRIVKKDIINQIETFSSHINVIKNEEILTLPNVFHLYGLITAKIDDQISASLLIDSLHPTPAVGGYPRNSYESYLKELEQKPRGPYAAPFGIISKNHTELSVGIRSLLINKNQLTLFSGCGIVKGSNAKSEWEETNHKVNNLILVNQNSEKKDKHAARTI